MGRKVVFRVSSEDIDDKTQCGCGSFSPRFLQRFANPKAYLGLYCLLGIIQGGYYTYMVGVITTLEKRFSFSSKVTGILLIADCFSGTFLGPLVGYYARKFHRPRMVALGMLMAAFSCFICAIPYFIYGSGDLGNVLESGKPNHQLCDPQRNMESCEKIQTRPSSFPAIAILFVSIFLNGLGSTCYYIVGTAYLDDNVKKKDSPLYFSILMALRIFGPALGFVISSFCLQYPEDLSASPGLTPDDPQWIGAWWLGMIIIGVLLVIFSIPISLFPRVMASCPSLKSGGGGEEKDSMPKLSEILPATMKLMKNKIYSLIILSGVLQVIGWGGFYTFLPKYMESSFHLSAYKANLYTGVTGPVSLLLGTVLGGYMVRRFQPRPRTLTGYMNIVDIVALLMFAAFIFLRCPQIQMDHGPGFTLQNDCNAPCHCTPGGAFDPVCHQETKNHYFSPCYAGCMEKLNDTSFSNCGCAPDGGSYTSGFCAEDCGMFLPFLILLTLGKFISSTCRVGGTLIVLRCVEPEEKDFSLGISSAFFNIFAFLPFPIIYGALTDAACVLWEEKCGETGNCWLYDIDKFRYYLHGSTAIFILAGNFFQLILWYYSKDIGDLYSDKEKIYSSFRRESERRLSTFSKSIS